MSVDEITEIIRKRAPGTFPEGWNTWDNTIRAMQYLAREAYDKHKQIEYPKDKFFGRGIVIAGGAAPRPHKGLDHGYFPCVWVCVNKIRALGCNLPIQVWHLGPEEMDPYLSRLLARLDVETVDARNVELKHPARILAGWELKPYSVLWSDFQEVLFIDADNHALYDPTVLFDDPHYQHFGSMFWPDYDSWILTPGVWKVFGMPDRREPAFESGMFIINKIRCWRELLLAMWYAEHSDFVFKHVYGDKEVFHLGWRYHGSNYAMPDKKPGWICGHTILQHDNDGKPVFAHRVQDKWKLWGGNNHCSELPDEDIHHEMANELRLVWDGKLWHNNKPTNEEALVIRQIVGRKFLYRRLPTGSFSGDERQLEFLGNGEIGHGRAGLEQRWSAHVVRHPITGQDVVAVAIASGSGLTALLYPSDDGCYRGRWVDHERCDVDLVPTGDVSDITSTSKIAEDVAGTLRRHGIPVDESELMSYVEEKLKVQHDPSRKTEPQAI